MKHRSDRVGYRRLSLVFFSIALILIILGTVGYIHQKNAYDTTKETCTADTQALVTYCEIVKVPIKSNNRTTVGYEYKYYTTVSYLVGDKEYTCFLETPHEYHKGNAVDLHYDPDDPKNAYIGDEPLERYNDGLICIILGGLPAAVGVATFLKSRAM